MPECEDRYSKESKGPKVDPELVERAKVMRDANYSLKSISKAVGRSVSTVQRYLQLPDAEEMALLDGDKERAKEIRKYRAAAWRIVHLASERLEAKLRDPDEKISAKDLALIHGIYYDKIQLSARAPEKVPKEAVTFVFVNESVNGTESRPIPHTVEVPRVSSEVQGDGVRPGRGQDILRLPGSREDGSGVSGVAGSDCSLDVSQHEGLCPADDNGRVVDGTGD